MNSHFPILCTVLTTLLVTTAWSDDNIGQVRNGIEARGGKVIWGKYFDHEEYLKASVAIAEGLGGVYATETVKQIAADFAIQLTAEALHRILQGETLTLGNNEIQGGTATYNNWHRTVHHEPRIRWKGPKSRIELVPVEHSVPLPNRSQLYLRFRLGYFELE